MRDPEHPRWPDEGDKTEDREDAEQWRWAYMDRVKGEQRRRRRGLPPARPLGKALDEYRRHRERTRAETTVASNNAILEGVRERFGERHNVHAITKDELQELFNGLLADDYAPSTLHTNRNALSAFFRWVGGHNPAKEVELPRIEKHEDPFSWGDDDVRRLRKAADLCGLRLLLELGLNTGGRLNELLALRWEDFNPEAKTVRFVRQFRNGTTKVKALKGKRARTALVLPDWWAFHEDREGYIITRDGEPLKSHQLYWPFQRMLENAGVDSGPSRGTHDMRRTFGRRFLEMGGWLDELQRSLGHKSIRTTEEQYGAFQADAAAEFARQRIYGEGRLRMLR